MLVRKTIIRTARTLLVCAVLVWATVVSVDCIRILKFGYTQYPNEWDRVFVGMPREQVWDICGGTMRATQGPKGDFWYVDNIYGRWRHWVIFTLDDEEVCLVEKRYIGSGNFVIEGKHLTISEVDVCHP